MTAESLRNYIDNDFGTHHATTRLIRRLREAVDRAAKTLAKCNAEWHDDPQGDPQGYAEHHADDFTQYPRETRDQVIKDLIEYWLAELTHRAHT